MILKEKEAIFWQLNSTGYHCTWCVKCASPGCEFTENKYIVYSVQAYIDGHWFVSLTMTHNNTHLLGDEHCVWDCWPHLLFDHLFWLEGFEAFWNKAIPVIRVFVQNMFNYEQYRKSSLYYPIIIKKPNARKTIKLSGPLTKR